MSDAVLIHRSAIAVAVRRGNVESERVARQLLSEAKIAREIEKAVNAAPPLTDEARARLVALLIGGSK